MGLLATRPPVQQSMERAHPLGRHAFNRDALNRSRKLKFLQRGGDEEAVGSDKDLLDGLAVLRGWIAPGHEGFQCGECLGRYRDGTALLPPGVRHLAT